jgi:hypothetical protein
LLKLWVTAYYDLVTIDVMGREVKRRCPADVEARDIGWFEGNIQAQPLPAAVYLISGLGFQKGTPKLFVFEPGVEKRERLEVVGIPAPGSSL